LTIELKVKNHAQTVSSSEKLKSIKLYSITSSHLAPLSKENYEIDVNNFLNHFHITDIQVLLDYGRDAIQAMVIKYVKHLRDDKQLSHATIKTNVAALYYFLDGEDILLNRQKIRREMPYDDEPKQTVDRPYTLEELQRLVSKCDERTKVIVLLMVSSGMRIDAVRELQLVDLTRVDSSMTSTKISLYRIQVYARSRHSYYTFCSPECARAIDDYLASRQKLGEQQHNPKAPLIREQYNSHDPIRIKSPRFLRRKTPIYLVNVALTKAGVKTKEVMTSHGFRKFFMSTCEQQMKSINVKILMGHDIGVENSYYHPKESEVLEDYLRAVDALTIDPTQRLQKRLDEQNLRHSEEWNALKAQMNELRKLLEEPIK
jgi:integrase